MRKLAVAALCFAVTAGASYGQTPRATRSADGTTRVTLPAAMLDDAAIIRHLSSGLTTVLLVRATRAQRDSDARAGGARIEVRYELWDEVYLTEVGDMSGRRGGKFRSVAQLKEWLEATPLLVLTPPAPPLLHLEVTVLPFSAREEADAQEWLSRSFREAQSVAALGKEVPQPAPASNFLDLLIGTSVKRKSTLRFRWSVPVEAGDR